MNKKEFLWLAGTIALIVALNFAVFGIDGFKAESVIDVNIYDTYYVISNLFFFFLFAVFTFFGIYLIRVLNTNFKNKTANLIFITSTILLIVVLTSIHSMIESLAYEASGWSIYPPSSAGNNTPQPDREPDGKESSLELVSNIILTIQIMLLILVTYCGYKTGANRR